MSVSAESLALTENDGENRIYTQEENYRAYKLFSMMDVDSGGSVTLRELYRVLMGDAIRYVSCDFDHPDTGIVWGLDEEACVSIAQIEDGSLALNFPFLILRMRVHSINGEVIPPHDPKSLELVYSLLLRLHDDPVTLVFLEPMIVINKFSCVLDIEMDHNVYPIFLPIGAVYNLDVFKRNMMKEMIKVNPYLKHIKVDFIPRKRQIFFKCKLYSFRLLFRTGPNNRRSCRYALGFSSEDTPLSNYHMGQPMLIDLNLGLDREKTEILMEELFSKYDRDGSGEFEFEEFRDFYIRYLDTDESLDFLRKYAKHRFRDIEHEKMVKREQLERENRARRRAYMKVKYHDLIEAQKAKFKADSLVDRYGNRRRLYRHRTGFNSAAEAKKQRKQLVIEQADHSGGSGQSAQRAGELEGMVSDDESHDLRSGVHQGSIVSSDGELTLYGGTRAVKLRPSAVTDLSGQAKLPPIQPQSGTGSAEDHSDSESAVTDPTLGPTGEDEVGSSALSDPISRREAARALRLAVQNGVITAEEAENIRRETAKRRQEQKQLRQRQRRKQVLKVMMEANKALNRAEKVNAKKFKESNTSMYLMEAHAVIKRALVKSFRMKGTDYEETKEISWDVSHVVASPALTIDTAILSLAVDLDNVNVADMDASRLHPAGLKYFFIRESKKSGADFNAKLCHPAFFCADFERFPTRHSRVALSIAKTISNLRAVGEQYREERGIKRVTDVPPEDVIPDKYADRPKKVRFLIDYKDPISAATVVARLTVLTIKVTGLPSIHLVEDNSPFVQLKCGSFRFATEINALAGCTSMWDELNWVLRLHHGDALSLAVLSGTVANHKQIGTLSFAAQEVLALKADANSCIKLTGKIMDREDHCGSFEADVFIEHGNEWDWHVTQYKKEQDRLYVKQHSIKKFSQTFHGEETEIMFPLAITISKLALLDMKAMHLLKRNRPYVELSCGNTQQRSSVQDNVLDYCAWDDVRWKVTLVSENANLIFLVYSEKVSMGRFVLTGGELARLHRNKDNIVEVTGDVVLNSQFTAKITFQCKLHASTDASTFLSTASARDDLTLPDVGPEVDYSKDVQLPCVITLHAVELSELPQVNQLRANSPQVVLTCGHFSSTTLSIINAGSSALWTDMNVSFPIMDKLHVEWKVFSSFVEIGSMVLRAMELVKAPRDRNGVQIITRDLVNGKDVCGKITVAVSYALEGRSYTVGKQLTKLQQQAYKEPTVGGYGHLPLSGSISNINETAEVVVDKYNTVAGKTIFQDSRTIQDSEYPFRFTVTDIVANDLKSVHLLAKNSPSVCIVCGTMSATTKEIPRAGASAIWAGLSAVVFLQPNSSVRVSVFSKAVCIGSHLMECATILDCTPDLSGNREAFVTISDEEGRTTGKLKVTFVLEAVGSYTIAPLPFDTSAIRKGLDFPILVNVRTISLFQLRSVHRYSSNSPFVKAKCGKWQGATAVLDYAGRDAKWRDMEWDFVVDRDTPLRLTVQSGTIVVGVAVLSPETLLGQNPNNQGLCELAGMLVDSAGRTIEAGQFRITYSYEAHVDENSVNSDSESEGANDEVQYTAIRAPNNFLTLVPSLSTIGSDTRSSAPRAIGHCHVLSIAATGLPSVHALLPNSPFVKISCDDYRAVTTTLYGTGSEATWKDLLISFEITRKSVLVLNVVSGQDNIGEYTVEVKHLLTIPTNAEGHTEYKAPLFDDGKLAGQVALLLHIDRFNRFGFGDSAVLSEEGYRPGSSQKRLFTPQHQLAVDGEESLELDAKTYKSHDISRSPITLPFVLRIVRVIALDVHPDLRKYFEGPDAVLRVSLERWHKHTPSCTPSGPVSNFGEWVDAAWVFVISSATAPLGIAVMAGNQVVGDLHIAMSDVVATPPSARGLIELPAYLYRGGKVPCGKLKVCMAVSPYSSPTQEILPSPPHTPAQAGNVGSLWIKFIRVVDLFQVYGLFPNSPKVSVAFGSYRNSTSVAVDAGSDYTWTDLNWGRIPVFLGTTFIARVTSGNELIGTFQVTSEDLLLAAARVGGKTAAIIVEGDILDGAVCKGRFEMRCVPTLTMQSIAEGDDESERVSTPGGPRREADGSHTAELSGLEEGRDAGRGFRPQVSWVSSVSGAGDEGDVYDAGFALQTPDAPQVSRTIGLSVSTPTPDITVVTFCGISVYDLQPQSAVFRNSPQVQLVCDEWSNETTVATFAGANADWILKRSSAWEMTMRANTFLKLAVLTGTAVIGAVCISTRELMEVPRNRQGLSSLLRDLEHNLEHTGKIRIVVNLEFKKSPEEKRVTPMPSLLMNSFGLPSLASYYPTEKKPSVSNTVMRTDIRGAQEPGMVAANRFELELPVNLHIMDVSCDGLVTSLVQSANALSVVVKVRGAVLHRSGDCVNIDKHLEWELLGWDVAVNDTDCAVNLSLQSSLGQVADITLSVHELLSAPRTSQGYVEITRSLRVLGNSTATLQIRMLLTPYLSPELRELYAQQVEEELKEDLNQLQKVAEMQVELISLIDVSPLYRSLNLSCAAGDFCVGDCLTFNVSGSAVWGSLAWKGIPVMERTNMVLVVKSDGGVLGKLAFSAADLLASPVDQTGLAVIYGELLDGLAYRGTMSMTFRLHDPPKLAPTAMPHAVVDAQGAVVAINNDAVVQKELVSSIVIHAAVAKSMKPVHKVGKNSPMLKLEVKGLKFQSNSLPYAGSRAEWTDLLWAIDSTPVSKVKVMVTSGSVQVGTAMTTNRAMFDVFEGVKKDGFLTLDLVKNGSFMGVVTLALRLETRPQPARKISERDTILFVPENAHHIPSEGDSLASEEHKELPDLAVTSPSGPQRERMQHSIEQFRANRRLPDDGSLQSARSLESSHSAATEVSDWTDANSVTGEFKSGTGTAMLLPSLPEDRELQVGAGEALDWLSGRSSARSVGSHSSAGSSTSRPKSSRGADPAQGQGKASSEHPMSVSASPGLADSPQRASRHGSIATGSKDEGSYATNSTSSFTLDTVASSYVMHSADLAEYRERTIHTIREEESQASSAASEESSLLHSSRSEDSSTAFDESVSHSSLVDSMNRSIYSASNSLSGSSAYSYSLEPDPRSYAVRSHSSASEFSTEIDTSSKSVASESLATRESSIPVRSPVRYDGEGSVYSQSVDQSSVGHSTATPSMSQSRSLAPSGQSPSSASSGVSGSAYRSHQSSSGSRTTATSASSSSHENSSRGPVSFFQPRVSSNTASFLQGTFKLSHPPVRSQSRSGGPDASSTALSKPPTARSFPNEGSRASAAWVDDDASTIETEESGRSYSDDGDRSDASSDYSDHSYHSDGYSTSSYASKRSRGSEPSREAHTIYSGYPANRLSARSSQYSADGTSEGSQTSRSGASDNSDFSAFTAASGVSGGSARSLPPLAHGRVSGERPGFAFQVVERPAPPPVPLHDGVLRIGLAFDCSRLDWLPRNATPQSVVAFTAQRVVNNILRSVVGSFVAMETGGDFQAARRGNHNVNFLTFSTERRVITRDLAFFVAEDVIFHAASRVLSMRCHSDFAAQVATEGPRIIPDAGPSTKNPFLDGTLKKRAGVTLTGQITGQQGLSSGNFAKITDYDSDDDPIYGGLVKQGKVEEAIPQKARITFQDILSIDLSFLDPRIMPKRPYLTCCKPYGNWAAETGPAWRSLDGMRTSDLVLNWYDLSNTLRWERFVLRRGQFLVFDLHDAGSGLLFAKARLPYSTIINKYMATRMETVTVFIEFDVANEYGGGKLGGVARMDLDLSVNVFVRSKKSVEFWDTHRSEHWTAFPITPITTGVVRQKYREVANDYDQQRVVHPCFFGFRARWRGNPEDEARFIHPMFRGFKLTKKPTPKKLVSELSKNMQKDAKPNPWRWDANAAALGRCPVCTDGVSGCPRCFMYPMHKTGFPSTAQEFAYDPDRERQKQRDAEQKQIRAAHKRKRRMERMKLSTESGKFEEGSLGSLSEEHDSDGEDDRSEFTSTGSHYTNANDPHMTLHTNLTTYKSLRAYRNVVQRLMTVFVKLIPTGYVRKFVVDSSDTIFHLYNMYNSHSSYGTAHSSMLLIPTIVGMFELHPELAVESDLLMAVTRGRDTLGDYGLNERNGTVVMLFIPNYKKEYVPIYLSTFFEKNTDFNLKHLPMYDTIEKLPPTITGDIVQKYLKGIIELEYAKQQSETAKEFIQRGLTYHQSRDAQAAVDMKKMRERSQAALKEKYAQKLRVESQLKGLTGAERKAAKIAMKKRELDKKRSVLYEKEKLEHDTRRSAEFVMSRSGKSGGTVGSGLGILKCPRPSSSRSSGSSVSDSSFGSASESSEGDSTVDGSSDNSSSSGSSDEDTSSSDDSDDDDARGGPKVDEADRGDDEFAEGPDQESTPILSPRGGRPLSARSEDSAGSRRKFYVVDGIASRQQGLFPDSARASVGSSQVSQSVESRDSMTRLSSLSPDSSVTGAGRSAIGPSETSESVGSLSSRSYSTHDSRSEYTSRSGAGSSYPTSRSGSSYTTYTSYTDDESSAYTRPSVSSRPSSAASSGSYYSQSSGTSYRTGDSYTSYGSYSSYDSYASCGSESTYTTYTADSLNSDYYTEDRGPPHHRGTSVHSLYSGLTGPASIQSSQASGPSVPTLYSGLPSSHGSASLQESSQGSLSSRSSGSYTSFVYTDSQASSRSRSNSDSTGGLFTYRSALESLPSSRSSSSASTYFTHGRGDRPHSAAGSAYSDSTYQSLVSEVSEASSYESSEARDGSTVGQRTKGTLFSGDYVSNSTDSQSTYSGSDNSYYTGSYCSDSRRGSLRSESSNNTAPSYTDISIYSSDSRSYVSSGISVTHSGYSGDDASETSQSSTGARSLYSSTAGSYSANSYPSGRKYRHNQYPLRTGQFEASQETLRRRFEKMKKARDAVQQSQFRTVSLSGAEDGASVGSASTATAQVSNFYADGTPVRPPRKRALTPPRASQPGHRHDQQQGAGDSQSAASSLDTHSYGSSTSRSWDRRASDYSSQSSASQSLDSASYVSAKSASTYASEREKRRLMKVHKPRGYDTAPDNDSRFQYSQYTLDSARSDSADSTYSGTRSDYSSYSGSSYGSSTGSSKSGSYTNSGGYSASTTPRSQYTADSSITADSYPSPRSGFVQRKRAHLQHAASYRSEGERSVTTAASSESALSDPRGSHILSRGSLGSSTYLSASRASTVSVSDSGSDFFAFSEDSGSRSGEPSRDRFYSSGDSLGDSWTGSQRSAFSADSSSSRDAGSSASFYEASGGADSAGYTDSSYYEGSSSTGQYQQSSSEGSSYVEPPRGSRPRSQPRQNQHQRHPRGHDGESASVGSHGSSSTGTVDYIYRSDVLSADGTAEEEEDDEFAVI